MKILFLSRRFYPDEGGVEKHVYELSKKLIEKGHNVTVVTQSEGILNSYKGIKIVRIPSKSKKSSEKLHIWKWFWKNRNLIREADVIHSHDVYFWYWPSRLIYLSKKSFVTFHGYESYPIKKKALITRKISEKLSNGNIIIGDFIKKWYKTNPDFVSYGAVEIPSKTLSQAHKKESAVFIGRLDEQTSILDYARAIDLIMEKYPNFDFKILGNGKYFSKLKKYKPAGFRKDIEIYLESYNFAFVSRYLAILEALASKRMVFALYDNPIKEDYLRMAPFSKFIVIEDKPEKIAEKVEYYLKNQKESKKLIDKGYEWVKKQSWEQMANVYLKLWNK